MKPLAHRLRPKSFDDLYGQETLIGKNGIVRKMIENKKLFSIILFGPPGTGKTTIANIISTYYQFNSALFNASCDNKAKLKDIFEKATKLNEFVLIIDEIHRMKKDIQDFLLPNLENGIITIIGITTENPYKSLNPAIRSRCHLLKVNKLKEKDIMEALAKIKDKEYPESVIDCDVFEYISKRCNNELRTAINYLELLHISNPNAKIDLEYSKLVIQRPAFDLDKNGNNYYNYLSGLQKSIRGSDVNASLYYLAKLILQEDLTSICRRLQVIAYEDIGNANPQIGPRVIAACKAAENVGFPEARIPLSTIVVDMALSPKSNSSYTALDNVLNILNEGIDGEVPEYIKPGYGQKYYKYPFDFDDNYILQQYLPDELKDMEFINFKSTSKYENALSERYYHLKKLKTQKKGN